MTNLLNKLKESSNKPARNDRLASNEYERYVISDFVSHLSTEELAGYDVLGFWKAKKSTFFVLSRIARDILNHLDATNRIQHTSNLENSLEFEEEILEEEVLENEAIALSDEEIALDEAASEARSNGSGGEEIDMTLSNWLFEFRCIMFDVFFFPMYFVSNVLCVILNKS
ncbi:hypothetical protein Tco_0249968 [Tanacetum coccineum]